MNARHRQGTCSLPAVEHRLIAAALIALALSWNASVFAQDPQVEEEIGVFEAWESAISLPETAAEFSRLPDTQIHDAYDADRNGVYIRIVATFVGTFADGEAETVAVPCFAMRRAPGAPWEWVVRWSPRREGAWRVRIDLEGSAAADGDPFKTSFPLLAILNAKAKDGIEGPLVLPTDGQNPLYLRRAQPDGSSRAVWLFGACRAWVVPPNHDSIWGREESLDRATELFAPMREAGYNLLNQWMAPWEFLLVHHDQAEHWRKPDGAWEREPLTAEAAWSPFQCYDQGRAAAFDDLVRMCEGKPGESVIHLMLCPLAHHSLQMRAHPWGYNESGWSPEDDGGRQRLEKLNGFSGFKADMSAWDFFQADPACPLDDARSQLFDHEANFYRYLIARWGHSRALGIWVLMDEVDAVGDVIGSLPFETGWWERPECGRWLANIVRMFRGELARSDGLRYVGDPYRHPLHAAATAEVSQGRRGGNLDWDGGPPEARVDVLGWHWYPLWPSGTTWRDAWRYAVDGLLSFADAPTGPAPRIVSEFGAMDRWYPEDQPWKIYPSLYHHAIWAGVFSGHAGTPMDWDDGKEFGELRWRARRGAFHRTRYPIDNTASIKALREFLGGTSPEATVPCIRSESPVKITGDAATRACALYSPADFPTVLGWVFTAADRPRVTLTGLPEGEYELTWYDPWTGRPVPDIPVVRRRAAEGVLVLDIREPLRRLQRYARAFPDDTRDDRGADIAFKLIRLDGAE